MPDNETPRRITEPLPPVAPVPTREDQELKAARQDLKIAQAQLARLALLTAQVKLIQRRTV